MVSANPEFKENLHVTEFLTELNECGLIFTQNPTRPRSWVPTRIL